MLPPSGLDYHRKRQRKPHRASHLLPRRRYLLLLRKYCDTRLGSSIHNVPSRPYKLRAGQSDSIEFLPQRIEHNSSLNGNRLRLATPWSRQAPGASSSHTALAGTPSAILSGGTSRDTTRPTPPRPPTELPQTAARSRARETPGCFPPEGVSCKRAWDAELPSPRLDAGHNHTQKHRTASRLRSSFRGIRFNSNSRNPSTKVPSRVTLKSYHLHPISFQHASAW
jgi:hypothetical protein